MTATSIVERGIGNPFATRHVRPGRMPPLDTAGRPLDIAMLVRSLAALGGSAAIVGPHGSGKSTLLAKLAESLECGSGRVERVRVRGPMDLIRLLRAVARCARGGVVCADSWERIGRPVAAVLGLAARLIGTRLLVTAHRPGPLPTLFACKTSLPLLAAIVERLPGAPVGSTILGPDMEEAFQRSRGDVREALFLLYDRFEERTRPCGRRGDRGCSAARS